MGQPHVVSALVRKRAELMGERVAIEQRTRAIAKELEHVDATLRMFGYDLPPELIKPVRPYKRKVWIFKPNQLHRMCADAMREGVTDNREIAARVIRLMGWDASNETLADTVLERVRNTTKRMRHPPKRRGVR